MWPKEAQHNDGVLFFTLAVQIWLAAQAWRQLNMFVGGAKSLQCTILSVLMHATGKRHKDHLLSAG